MSVEVRQLIVKSNVVHADKPAEGSTGSREDMESMKREIIHECKQMITELLREKRER